MPVTTPWRIGSQSFGWIDLPDPQVDGVDVSHIDPGGSSRSVTGALLFDRTGPVHQQWQMTLDPAAAALSWRPLQRMYEVSRGPWELYDALRPNLLSFDDRLGDGWVRAAGTPLPALRSMRLTVDATVTSAQTAVTSAPPLATLIPVTPSTTYTAAITADSIAGFTGTLAAYGYTGPSGSGTLQGAAVPITALGRTVLTFTTDSTTTWLALRVVRSAGSLTFSDPTLWPDTADPGASLRQVAITALAMKPHAIGDRAGFTITLEEI